MVLQLFKRISIVFLWGSQKPQKLSYLLKVGKLNRRQFARIKLPGSTVSKELPQFRVQSKTLDPIDLSRGGLCVPESEVFKGRPVGAKFEIKIKYQDTQETVQATIVGQSFQKIHIQFTSPLKVLGANFSDLEEVAELGEGLRKAMAKPEEDLKGEFWVGLEGQSLMIGLSPEQRIQTCRLQFSGKTFLIDFKSRAGVSLSSDQNSPLTEREYVKCLLFVIAAPDRSVTLEALVKDFESLVSYNEREASA